VAAVADAKHSFVERLFAEHRAGLQAFFVRRLRTAADAPDLAQEVYVRMLRVNDQDAIRNPRHYLYTVAHNLVKEHAALERRQAMGVSIDAAPVHEQLQARPAFDGDLDTKQRLARLDVVLRQLPPRARAAIVLKFTHELSYREIAINLGISQQMAKRYVAQGMRHCQRRMGRLG
jgi:RNA polymerase sigma factor (sigma-70 family)